MKTKKTSPNTSNPPRKWADIEKTKASAKSAVVIEDNKFSLLYPSPSDHPTFKSRWNEFIQNVAVRENFNRGHLEQLSLLCDLYVDYEQLSSSIAVTGYSYESMGQSGIQIKPYPEVSMRTRALSEIRNYSKSLGLVLVKDNSTREEEKEDEWS